ncbi:GNAT family N-acetyltransferase [candidate division KSB1 bacterium]|nr:GNAT family N-acetyltransferase [candidate division KSB1 bacterium]
MNESVQIRFATTEDIPILIQLLSELIRLETDFDANPDQMERGFQLLLSDPDVRRVFIAEVDGKAAGMCTGQLFPSSAEGGLVLLVEDFIVKESMRSHGIGRQLILAVEHWGVNKGAKRFQLLTDRGNVTVLEFYGRQGWTESNLMYLFKRPNP